MMLQSVIEENKRSNGFQSVLLIVAMAALMGIIGLLLFGQWGFWGALGLVAIGSFFSSQVSSTVVLRMYKAKRITPEQAPQLLQVFSVLCQRAELERPPRLYYIPSRMPNAFAFGVGENSGVAVTDGLFRMLSGREMAGVLAHEIAHVRHGDVKVMMLADMITRTTSMFSRFGIIVMFYALLEALGGGGSFNMVGLGVLLWAAPTISVLLQLALSRTREFNADQGAAELTGDPLALASALLKLQRLVPKGVQRVLRPGQHRKEPAMLRTHPPTEERVEKLKALNESIPKPETELVPSEPRHIAITEPRVRRKPGYHFISGSWH